MIVCRTPLRMSFFGGGTDYPEWYLKHGGQVLATTFNRYSYITCRHLPPFFGHRFRLVYSKIETVQSVDEIQHPTAREALKHLGIQEGLEIHYDGDLPARSGLGTSSAFTVGLLNAVSRLRNQPLSKKELAQTAHYIEQQRVGEQVGSQDQVSAAFGGFNRIFFNVGGGFEVEPVDLPRERLKELQTHLLLCFTGVTRSAEIIAQSKVDSFTHAAPILKQFHFLVDEALELLENPNANLLEFGKLLHESWLLKRSISKLVSSNRIDEMYDIARKAGAIGGKILGAGGGGFLLFFVEPEKQAQVKTALSKYVHVPFAFEHTGSQILHAPTQLRQAELIQGHARENI